MSKSREAPVLSGIPDGLQRRVSGDTEVSLLGAVETLNESLTPSLCGLVFRRVRKNERERKWTFAAIARFWTAMIVVSPPSIRHGIAASRKRSKKEDLWPRVRAEPQAFFQKCADLRADFFEALFVEFTSRLRPSAAPIYASWLGELRGHFPTVQVIDGSRLEEVCHRLKILWPIKSAVLSGCVTVLYDLFSGTIRQARYYGHAYSSERARAPEMLDGIEEGALILGDRIYCMLKAFRQLNEGKSYGLFRLRATLKIKRLEVFRLWQSGGRTSLEDVLVEVGQGIYQPKERLRLIRYRDGRYRLDLLTNVLDPEKLPAQTAVKLYGMRWSIERMFLDLKKTLKLHCLYAAHPNLVAQQFYAAAMVYNAMRVAQGSIAQAQNILPEQLSPGKLFPLMAGAIRDHALASWQQIRIRELNPGVAIVLPDLREMPTAHTNLRAILAQSRSCRRKLPHKKPLYSKSFKHIPGGAALLATVTNG